LRAIIHLSPSTGVPGSARRGDTMRASVPKPGASEVARNPQMLQHNTRVMLHGEGEDSDVESSDDEDVSVLDREAVKRNAQALLSQQEKGKRRARRVKGR
jgi:hypothetical protein